MQSPLETQEQLYSEATQLLQRVIFPTLKDHGEVTVGGSYVYKLLTHPDIDLGIVNTELTKEMYAKLCNELIALEEVSFFRSADRVHFPHANPGSRPTGYWIAPVVNYGGRAWNLDIWFQKPEWVTHNNDVYEKKLKDLGDDKRSTILILKEELMKEGIYGVGKEFLSVDVYDAVLDHDVKTIEELRSVKQR